MDHINYNSMKSIDIKEYVMSMRLSIDYCRVCSRNFNTQGENRDVLHITYIIAPKCKHAFRVKCLQSHCNELELSQGQSQQLLRQSPTQHVVHCLTRHYQL